MAGFDISTAKPVGGGFDISTAQPAVEQPTTEQSPDGVELMLNVSGQPVPEEKGFGEGVVDAFVKRGEEYGANISDIADDIGDNWMIPGAVNVSLAEAGRRTAGAFTGAVGDIVGEGMKVAADYLPESVKDSFKEKISEVSGTETAKDVASFYKAFKEKNPQTDRELRDMLNVLGFIPTVKVAKTALKSASTGTKKAANELTALIPQSAKDKELAQQLLLARPKELLSPIETKLIEGVEPKLIGGPLSKELATLEIKPRTTTERLLGVKRAKTTTDKIAKRAVRQGFDPAVIQSIKTGSRADKLAGKKMVNIVERTKDNAEYGLSHRPTDIVGDSLLKRFKVVKNANTRAGQNISKVVKSIYKKPFDAQKIESSFVNNLNEMGIKIGRNNKGEIKVDFKGSSIRGIPGLEKTVKDVVKQMDEAPYPNVGRAHELKKYLDEKIPYDKVNSGLQGKTEKLLTNLRRSINDEIKSKNKRYGTVNKIYSETVDALDELQSLAGKKNDILGEGGASMLGQKLRGIMSNNVSRTRLIAAYNNIEKLSKKYGGKFNSSIEKQVLLADEFDKVFKPAGRTSLQGQLQQQAERAAMAGMSPVFSGIQETGKFADKVMGINNKGAIRAIRALLNE